MAGSLLAAAALAAATPTNAELTALYDSICDGRTDPGGEFRPVAGGEIPDDLRGLYIGPQEGRYWRRQGDRPAFVVLTRGPGHWGGVEEYCIVAVQGADFEAAVATFARRLNAQWIYESDGSVRTWERWGMTNVTITDSDNNHASVLVTQRPDGWVNLFTGGQVTAASTRWGR